MIHFLLVPLISGRFHRAALAILVMTMAAASGQDAEKAGEAPPPSSIHVPKLEAELDLDGKLDEAIWRRAAEIPFFKYNVDGRREREGTRVKVWRDDEALYLGWLCKDTDIQATFTKRDSKFWEEEVVEFFVTEEKLGTYFELQWNPLGGVFDAIIHNQLDKDGRSTRFEGDWDFTARGMRSAVHVQGTVADSSDQDDFWSVEVRIPFRDLNAAPPKSGAVWRANFYRFSRGAHHETEGLSWSPTRGGSFHQPNRFGYLRF